LMYAEFDSNGDLDRMSFMVEVRNGKQEVIDMLPPLNAATATIPSAARAPAAGPARAASAKAARK